MTDVYELFKEEIWMPDDFTNCIWCENCGELSWNLDNSIEDLENGDGNTYSADRKVLVAEKEPYVMYIINDGCGNTYQAIFDLRNKKEF